MLQTKKTFNTVAEWATFWKHLKDSFGDTRWDYLHAPYSIADSLEDDLQEYLSSSTSKTEVEE